MLSPSVCLGLLAVLIFRELRVESGTIPNEELHYTPIRVNHHEHVQLLASASAPPGCPKKPVDDHHRWLFYSTGNNPHRRCFLSGTQGPCQPGHYFLPVISSDSSSSVPVGACFKRGGGGGVNQGPTKRPPVNWRDGYWKMDSGIYGNMCAEGEIYNPVIGKCTKVIRPVGGIGK